MEQDLNDTPRSRALDALRDLLVARIPGAVGDADASIESLWAAMVASGASMPDLLALLEQAWRLAERAPVGVASSSIEEEAYGTSDEGHAVRGGADVPMPIAMSSELHDVARDDGDISMSSAAPAADSAAALRQLIRQLGSCLRAESRALRERALEARDIAATSRAPDDVLQSSIETILRSQALLQDALRTANEHRVASVRRLRLATGVYAARHRLRQIAPERMIVDLKRVIAVAAPEVRSMEREELTTRVVSWAIEAYYAA